MRSAKREMPSHWLAGSQLPVLVALLLLVTAASTSKSSHSRSHVSTTVSPIHPAGLFNQTEEGSKMEALIGKLFPENDIREQMIVYLNSVPVSPRTGAVARSMLTKAGRPVRGGSPVFGIGNIIGSIVNILDNLVGSGCGKCPECPGKTKCWCPPDPDCSLCRACPAPEDCSKLKRTTCRPFNTCRPCPETKVAPESKEDATTTQRPKSYPIASVEIHGSWQSSEAGHNRTKRVGWAQINPLNFHLDKELEKKLKYIIQSIPRAVGGLNNRLAMIIISRLSGKIPPKDFMKDGYERPFTQIDSRRSFDLILKYIIGRLNGSKCKCPPCQEQSSCPKCPELKQCQKAQPFDCPTCPPIIECSKPETNCPTEPPCPGCPGSDNTSSEPDTDDSEESESDSDNSEEGEEEKDSGGDYEQPTENKSIYDTYYDYDLSRPLSKNELEQEVFKGKGVLSRVWNRKCGRAPLNPLSPDDPDRPYINGGHDEVYGEWPMFATLEVTVGNLSGQCGGVLISNQHILTAAHCVRQPTNNHMIWEKPSIVVSLADHERFIVDKFEKKQRVGHICPSLQYNDPNQGGGRYDYAILKLEEPVEFNDHIQPACLPFEPVPIENSKKSTCFVVGRGIEKYLNSYVYIYSTTTQKMRIKQASCRVWGIKDNDRSRHCFTRDDEHGDTCGGDSGGPVLCLNKRKRWVVMGLVSYGSERCDGSEIPGWVGVYARVRGILKDMAKSCPEIV